jgi:hypothetical protein
VADVKTPYALALLLLLSCGGSHRKGPALPTFPVETWARTTDKSFSTLMDEKGSKMTPSMVAGPKGSDRAVLVDYELKPGGYGALVYIFEPVDLSRSGTIAFTAKMDPPGSFLLHIADANKVIYTTKVSVPSATWSEVRVPIEAFKKNEEFQLPESKQGKDQDLTRVGTVNLYFSSPEGTKAKLWVGPITALPD